MSEALKNIKNQVHQPRSIKNYHGDQEFKIEDRNFITEIIHQQDDKYKSYNYSNFILTYGDELVNACT